MGEELKMTNKIEMIIDPRIKEIGDGFSVKRLLPYMKRRMVGPFIFWDHMGPVRLKPQEESNVLSHPHIGLATITYLFSGAILHRDSLGSEQLILPGEVNWMTAGSGIAHCERSKAGDAEMVLEGIQLWVALPTNEEDISPSFVHVKKENLPIVYLGSSQFSLIAGEFKNLKSPVPVRSPLFYLVGELNSNETIEMDFNPNHEAAIYVVDGEIEIENVIAKNYQMLVLKRGERVQLKTNRQTKLMIFGGEPFQEKRFIWWNFVSSSEEKIEKAKQAWQRRTFPQTIKETEFIPLPLDEFKKIK